MNTCVNFCDNRLRNEACREVKLFEYERTYVWANPYIPCEGIIHEAGTDIGKLYFFLNILVGGKNKELLPGNVSDMRLANNFSAFFENKINGIYEHIDNNDNEIRHLPDIPYCKLDKFKEGTLTYMKDILSKKNEKKKIVKEILFQ